MSELEKADVEQCQAEKPNGVNFMTLGGTPKLIRCQNEPIVIATETLEGDDGLRGQMSLCQECLEVAKSQLPGGHFSIKKIDHDTVFLSDVNTLDMYKTANGNTFLKINTEQAIFTGLFSEVQRFDISKLSTKNTLIVDINPLNRVTVVGGLRLDVDFVKHKNDTFAEQLAALRAKAEKSIKWISSLSIVEAIKIGDNGYEPLRLIYERPGTYLFPSDDENLTVEQRNARVDLYYKFVDSANKVFWSLVEKSISKAINIQNIPSSDWSLLKSHSWKKCQSLGWQAVYHEFLSTLNKYLNKYLYGSMTIDEFRQMLDD